MWLNIPPGSRLPNYMSLNKLFLSKSMIEFYYRDTDCLRTRQRTMSALSIRFPDFRRKKQACAREQFWFTVTTNAIVIRLHCCRLSFVWQLLYCEKTSHEKQSQNKLASNQRSRLKNTSMGKISRFQIYPAPSYPKTHSGRVAFKFQQC